MAILAAGDALALLPWGLFLALVLYGGTILKAQGLTVDLVVALTGLILFLACIGEVAANYRFVRISKFIQDVGAGVDGERGEAQAKT